MEKPQNLENGSELKQDYILRETVVSKLMIPFIQLFALYLIAHGESGPGGGFQGGVILGTSIILYILVYGLDEGRKKISQNISDVLGSTGVLLFAATGLLAMLCGGNFLEYDVLPLGHPEFASHMGILVVEIGIGITVAAIMVTMFCETIRRDDDA